MSERKERGAIDTPGRILTLLCSRNHTISELADELGISANGVRGHLARLEAQGLVSYGVVRRGVGKPAHEYRLTAEGSLRLSRAYLPLLSTLLTVAARREGSEWEESVLREAGRTLARQHRGPEGGLEERVAAGLELLHSLGALCSPVRDDSELWIEGACCPFRALVPDHPLACKSVEAMLEEVLGVPVREHCGKQDPPRCRLMIAAGPGRLVE